MTKLFDPPALHWVPSALKSIYVLYPNKQNRKMSYQRIEEALNRIAEGEIDGLPRTQKEAIEFLRGRTEEARHAYLSRERKWVPHSTTWYNQSKYLSPPGAKQEELPAQLEACVRILSFYPTTPSEVTIRGNVSAFLPALHAIDQALLIIDLQELQRRTRHYRDCVEQWGTEDKRYIPAAKRWFGERKFEQDPKLWERKSGNNPDAERDQVRRVLGI